MIVIMVIVIIVVAVVIVYQEIGAGRQQIGNKV